MTSAAQLAEDYRSVIDEAIDFVENATPEQWEATTSEEGWTVAATLHHVALGNQTVAGWIDAMRAGEPIELTIEEQDADNARHAAEYAHADQGETAELLRSTSQDLESLIRVLSATDLGSASPFGPAGGRELTVEQAAHAAAQHARSHLDHALAAAGDTE